MADLCFDRKGNLKPYSIIPCTLEEIYAFFVDGIKSETRKQNFDHYLKYSSDLKRVLGNVKFRQWINGSFVTSKSNPKDIDFVTFIDKTLVKKLGSKLEPFKAPESWTEYKVDAYIIETTVEGSPLWRYTEADIAYWHELFSHNRRDRTGKKRPKGFLEVIY